jgi:hypothetical protein
LNLLQLLPFRHIQELRTFASSKGKANAAQDEIIRIWGGNQDLTSEKSGCHCSGLPFLLEVPELKPRLCIGRHHRRSTSSTASKKERRQSGCISWRSGEPLQQARMLRRRPQRRSNGGIGLKCAPVEGDCVVRLLLKEGEVGQHRLEGHGRRGVRARELGGVVSERRLLLHWLAAVVGGAVQHQLGERATTDGVVVVVGVTGLLRVSGGGGGVVNRGVGKRENGALAGLGGAELGVVGSAARRRCGGVGGDEGAVERREAVDGGGGGADEPLDGLAGLVDAEAVLDVVELDGRGHREADAAVPEPPRRHHLAVAVLAAGRGARHPARWPRGRRPRPAAVERATRALAGGALHACYLAHAVLIPSCQYAAHAHAAAVPAHSPVEFPEKV